MLWSRSSGGAPWWTYWSAGITNTIGPAMGIEALKYISYPAQASLLFLFVDYWFISHYVICCLLRQYLRFCCCVQVLAKSSKMIPG